MLCKVESLILFVNQNSMELILIQCVCSNPQSDAWVHHDPSTSYVCICISKVWKNFCVIESDSECIEKIYLYLQFL